MQRDPGEVHRIPGDDRAERPKPIRPGSVLLLLCVIAYLFYLGHSFAVRRFVETVRAVLAAIPTHLYGG